MTEMRPGLSLSYSGRRNGSATKRRREFPNRGPTSAHARAISLVSDSRYGLITNDADWTSMATAQMKPTSSRAIAVHATVVFLPRATKDR
jgi:hypothetical protein